MEDGIFHSIHQTLCDIRQATKTRPDLDRIVQLSNSLCYTLDYRDRYHVYVWSANTLTLTLEDLGTVTVEGGSWTNLSFTTGMRIFAQGQSSIVPILVRCTDTSLEEGNSAYGNYIESAGYISLSSPPAQTNAGADTPLTFSSQVNHVFLQNNTSANLYCAFDTAASLGSILLVPGATLIEDKKCTALHLYTVAAQNINGTSVGNIVVLGSL